MIVHSHEFNPHRLVGFPKASGDMQTRVVPADRSVFRALHQSPSFDAHSPLHELRKVLLHFNEIFDDGTVNMRGTLFALPPPSVSEVKIDAMLNSSFTVTSTIPPSEASAPPDKHSSPICRLTLKELTNHYLKLFPNHQVHWIGGSLPLDRDWLALCLKNYEGEPEILKRAVRCLSLVSGKFSDIDIRFMSPAGSPGGECLRHAIEDLCRIKTGNPSFVLNAPFFRPEEGTRVLSFKKGGYDCFDIDLIECSHTIPPYLTTLDTAYLPLNEYLYEKVSTPRFLGGVTAGVYAAHKLAKIFYVPHPSLVNPGSFKRYIQYTTGHFITPQAGLVHDILTSFRMKKGGKKQFLAVFQERKEHLSSNPKTILAYALNLASCINEYYDEGYKVPYWRECAKLVMAPEEGLSQNLASFIQESPHGCGYLLTALKSCGLMIYAAGELASELPQSLPNISLGVQNGEPYMVMPIDDSTIHLKLEAGNTHAELADMFTFLSASTRDDLRQILIKVLKLLFQIKMKPNGSDSIRALNKIGINLDEIQKPFSKTPITADPVIHALSLFWKAVDHLHSPRQAVDEWTILRSLIPTLTLFPSAKNRKQIIDFIAASIQSELISDVLEALKESSRSDFPGLFNTLLNAVARAGVQSTELGFQIWREALKHPDYIMAAKCEGLVELTQPAYETRKACFYRRVQRLLAQREVNPLILTHFLVDRKLGELIFLGFDNVTEDDAKMWPHCLSRVSHYSKFNLPRRLRLIFLLVEQNLMDEAVKHIKKIHMPLLPAPEKQEINDAAIKVINDYMARQNPNTALEVYQSFLKKGCIQKSDDDRWNLLDKAAKTLPQGAAVGDDWLFQLEQVLDTPVVLTPGRAAQIETIFLRFSHKVKFDRMLPLFAKLHAFATRSCNESLLALHEARFNHWIKNIDDGKRKKAARYCAKRGLWVQAAASLLRISKGNRQEASQIAYAVLKYMSRQNADKLWNLFIAYRHVFDQKQTASLISQLTPYCSQLCSTADQKGALSNTLNRLSKNHFPLAIEFLDRCLESGVKFKKVPLIFELNAGAAANHRACWRRYQQICETQRLDKWREAQRACLFAINDVCLKKRDLKLIGAVVRHWCETGLDDESFEKWASSAELILMESLMCGRVESVVEELKVLQSLCTPRRCFRALVARFFWSLLKAYHSEGLISAGSIYQIWDLYSRQALDDCKLKEAMYTIASEEGNMERAWSLLGDSKDRFVFFANSARTADEREQELQRTRKWLRLMEHSVSAHDSSRHPEILNFLLKTVNRDVMNTKRSLDDRRVIDKTIAWAQYPDIFYDDSEEYDSSMEKALKSLKESKIELIHHLIKGLWSLTHGHSLELKSSVKHRLQIMGAVLWFLFPLPLNARQVDPDMSREFIQLGRRHRETIEEILLERGLELDNPDDDSYLKKVLLMLLQFSTREYVIVHISILLQSLLFYFFFLPGRGATHNE